MKRQKKKVTTLSRTIKGSRKKKYKPKENKSLKQHKNVLSFDHVCCFSSSTLR